MTSVGLFPDEKNPRVLWIGAEPHIVLDQLKRVIDRHLPNYKDDYEFKSHITFARLKFIRPDERTKLVEKVKSVSVEAKEWDVKEIFQQTNF